MTDNISYDAFGSHTGEPVAFALLHRANGRVCESQHP
jgi:hypothetical protein